MIVKSSSGWTLAKSVCLIAAAGVLCGAPAAAAQSGDDPAAAYPVKPVRLLVGPAVGGPTDLVGRTFAPRLGELWRKHVLVDNRPGVGNTIATRLTAAAAPDGHTLLLCPLSDAIAPAVFKHRLPYDFLRDITGVSKIGTTANVLVVHPSVAVASVREFVDHAKAQRGKLSYGAQSRAQAGYLSMELLKRMAGMHEDDLVYVS
jgi:tripartite-type tricarboxylate transporter receptor subunit TctC